MVKKHKLEIEEMHKPGVYAIHNIISDKYYIGSSVDAYERIKIHYQAINGKKRGSNYKIIEDCIKYGRKSFEFLYIQVFENGTITENELRKREYFYIKKYNANVSGYNSNIHNPGMCGKFKKDDLIESRTKFILCSDKNNKLKLQKNIKRISVVLPLSQWKQITEKIGQNGSMNAYIRGLIDADLKKRLPVSDPSAQSAPDPDTQEETPDWFN